MTNLLSVSIDLSIPNISFKWSHTICDLLRLAPFISHNVFKVYPCCNTDQYFLSFYGQIIFHCVDTPHFAYPFISWWHLGGFHVLTIVNRAAVNIHVQVFVWKIVFNSFGYIPGSGLAESYANSIFNLLRNHQIVFHSGCTILQSYQQGVRAPISHLPAFKIRLSPKMLILESST